MGCANPSGQYGEYQRHAFSSHVVNGMNGQRLKRRHNQGVTGQYGNAFTELGVHRWFATALGGVVEARQIVVDQ